MDKQLLYQLFENPEQLNEKTISELKSLVDSYPWFQAGWFLYLKNLKECNSPKYPVELKKAAIAVTDRKKLFNFLNTKSGNFLTFIPETSEYQLDDKTNSAPTGKNSLIDKFLSSKTFLGKLNKEEQKQLEEELENEIVINSTSENDEIITETLALIYFKQKKYDKAIEAFEKLSLKYPEKSVNFAARIKDIETLKNF